MHWRRSRNPSLTDAKNRAFSGGSADRRAMSTRSMRLPVQGMVRWESRSSALIVGVGLVAAEQPACSVGELTPPARPYSREFLRPLPGAHVFDVGQRDTRAAL